MERLLLHICCAPCSVYCIDSLRDEGIEPAGFWYNPNIHPYQEYKARRDTLIEYSQSAGLELTVRDDYGLRDFVQAVAGDLATATPAVWRKPPGMPPSTASPTSPRPCWSVPTRTTRASAGRRRSWRGGMAWNSSTGTSVPASARGRPRRESWGSTCRNTAAASSPRRSGTPGRSRGIRRNLDNSKARARKKSRSPGRRFSISASPAGRPAGGEGRPASPPGRRDGGGGSPP